MPIKDLSSNVTREIVAQPLWPQKSKPTSSERLASVSPFPFGSRGINTAMLVVAGATETHWSGLHRITHKAQSVSFRTGFFL